MLIISDRDAFDNAGVNLPNGDYHFLSRCVWRAPNGFSEKHHLRSIYGQELDRLFQDILCVANATVTEVLQHLQRLKDVDSTTMDDVAEVYMFLQKHSAFS